MQAVVYEKYGPPDVLELRQVATPAPKDDEVLIRIHAVSINDWDWALLQGVPFVFRVLSGFRPKRKILGSDVAGRIEAVGKDVKRFKPGDEVFGDLSGRWGGFAEYVCAPEKALAFKPPAMTFVEAAAIPQAAMLAVQGLLDAGRLQPGQKLLINGAGGGVGTFAVQIARLYEGVEVTGVDSPAKLDLLRSLGFDKVIDYTQEDFTRSGARHDLILDVKINRSIFDYLRALSPGGTYVTVGGSLLRIFQLIFVGRLVSLMTGKALRLVVLKQNKDLGYMIELFEAGKMKPVVDKLRKLSEVPEAMRYFGAAMHKGKVVITLE
jgi:NADPH:quinone reductase-like Zn-dependent oxidoreductase